ncbi:MAG: DUF2569 family protein [Candidatus Pacearchaeota archaeon]|nr:DUF2569 family protein [Candidatus Pacearchaeota archaeon]
MAKKKAKKKLRGINGWLILPMLGFMIEIAIILKNLIQNYIRTEIMILGLVMIAFYALTLIFLFKEKKQTPVLAIIALWLGFAYALLSNYPSSGSFVADGIGAVIWTWYFNVSKRVKNTFVK